MENYSLLPWLIANVLGLGEGDRHAEGFALAFTKPVVSGKLSIPGSELVIV